MASSAFLLASGAAFGTQYVVQALDPAIGSVYSINDQGQTAGNGLGTQPLTWDAYIDFGSGPVDIGKPSGDSYAIATQLNDHGMASGMSRWVDPSDPYNSSKWVTHSFVYKDGALTPLGTLAGGSQSSANGINDAGQVVGSSESSAGTRGFLWQNGVMNSLEPLAGDDATSAFGIDDDGDIVGMSGVTGHGSRPVLFHDGTATALPGLAGATNVYSLHTSRDGAVVGTASGLFDGLFGDRSWILRNGQAVDLGSLYGSQYIFANAVNDSGLAVGYLEHLGQRAFVYDGEMHDLNDLLAPQSAGWNLTHATWVNDAGQIVGSGSFNGVSHAFIATPVPEPSAMIALGFGVAAFARRRRPGP